MKSRLRLGRRARWYGLGPFLTVIIIAVCSPPVCYAQFVRDFDLYYSLEYTRLTASAIDLWGATVENDQLEGVASRGGLSFSMGRAVPIRLGVEYYSTESLIPEHFGSAEATVSLKALSVLLGFSPKWAPVVQIGREKLAGTGVVDSDSIIFLRDGKLVSNGTLFPLATEIESISFLWNLEKFGDGVFPIRSEGGYLYYGPGYAEFSFLGVKQDISGGFNEPSLLDQEITGGGLFVPLSYNSGTIPLLGSDRWRWFFLADAEAFISDIGGMIKAGYGVGLDTRIGPLSMRASLGGFFWKIAQWGDLDFGIAETDFAYTAGLSVQRAW